MKYIMLHGLGQSSESWSDTVKVFNDDLKLSEQELLTMKLY